VIDVGGYSTRPGHADIAVEEEIGRVVPVIIALRNELDLPLSIDTFRVEVAEAALDAGAVWLNDVSGWRQAGSAREVTHLHLPVIAVLAARRRVPLVLMDNRAPLHVDNRERDVQNEAPTPDIVSDVRLQLNRALDMARRAGVPRWHRVIDPGIGFGKSVSQHVELIRRLDELAELGYPLLFGASRKGFLGKLAEGAPVGERLAATIAANVLAVERGARIVRVHDVRENVQALRVVRAIMEGFDG